MEQVFLLIDNLKCPRSKVQNQLLRVPIWAKSEGMQAPPAPSSAGPVPSKRYRCWCAAPGKISDTTQHLMKNVRSVFIPLRVFRHVHSTYVLSLFSFEYSRVWTQCLQRSYFDYYSRKSLACVQSLRIVPDWQ